MPQALRLGETQRAQLHLMLEVASYESKISSLGRQHHVQSLQLPTPFFRLQKLLLELIHLYLVAAQKELCIFKATKVAAVRLLVMSI